MSLLCCYHKLSHQMGVASRIDQQMDVLGHQHIGPELKAKFHPARLQRYAKPFPRPRAVEKRKAAVARERQFPGLARFVVTLPSFFDVGTSSLGIDNMHESHPYPMPFERPAAPRIAHA